MVLNNSSTTSVSELAASSTRIQSLYSNSTYVLTGETTTVNVQDQERYLDTDISLVKMRYQVYVDPPESANYLEGVILCDPSAVDIQSKDAEECGKIFRIDSIRKGKRSINIDFKNKSRFPQSIVFALEVFDKDKNTVGFVEKPKELIAPKPVINLNIDNDTITQYGSASFQTKNCGWDEGLDFIRYTMTPYSPTNPISLPICFPGELLCNKGNPPTYCKITGGPSSDDLCFSDQKFENGKCVTK